MQSYQKLWAKTSDGDDSHWHPLYKHSLDVAAVADLTLRRRTCRLSQLADRIGCSAELLHQAIVWLVSLHDIGKASRAFQGKVATLWDTEHFGSPPRTFDTKQKHHTVITGWYLDRDAKRVGVAPTVVEQLRATFPGWDAYHLDPLIEAVAGHHGQPIDPTQLCHITPLETGDHFIAAAQALANDLRQHIATGPLDGVPTHDDEAYALGWFIATLLPFCDWVGSNQDYFTPDPTPTEMSEYWGTALQLAERALDGLGLIPGPVSNRAPTCVLPKGTSLSPIQDWAATVQLNFGEPNLFIIEDMTGSGKTEAGLILAHRMLQAGMATGLHVALPTMATANAMYARITAQSPNLFDAPNTSVSLAHGRARRMRFDPDSVAAYCAPWIAHDNRRAFFAQLGAGTIDQAVLSVLPSKYQSLRLFGLADKTLILDEVHAFDAYVSEEVAALLRFHAAQGSSAILLSATLTQAKRQSMIAAFAAGAGYSAPVVSSSAYPLATVVVGPNIEEAPLEKRAGTKRRVAVKRLGPDGSDLALASEAAAQGAAVAIIRTTVDRAIATYEALNEHSGRDDTTIGLFHARFLPCDRNRIEQDAITRFGKKSEPNQRRGQILVATQVIEQSLDVDFDVVITDLAPIDLLIQRAGRLWRHDRTGNRPDVTPEPVLHVVSPPPPAEDAGDDWLDGTLPEARWVYRDAALLWRSAMALFADAGGAGEIVTDTFAEDAKIPGHPRALVERIYSGSTEDLSSALANAWDKQLADAMGVKFIAQRQVLRPDEPYQYSRTSWEDDTKVATRLGDSVTVRLANETDDGLLVPLVSGGSERSDDWGDAEVRLTPRVARELQPPSETQKRQLSPPWRSFEESIRLLVLGWADGRWVDSDEKFFYSERLGLVPRTRGDDP